MIVDFFCLLYWGHLGIHHTMVLVNTRYSAITDNVSVPSRSHSQSHTASCPLCKIIIKYIYILSFSRNEKYFASLAYYVRNERRRESSAKVRIY